MNENISTKCYTIETHFTIFAFEQSKKEKETNKYTFRTKSYGSDEISGQILF